RCCCLNPPPPVGASLPRDSGASDTALLHDKSHRERARSHKGCLAGIQPRSPRNSPMPWTPPVHVLLSPITADDGTQIEQITLKPLFYAAQKEALARAGDDEDDQFFELAQLATGLSVKELDQLKRPDYVSIAHYVHEMST